MKKRFTRRQLVIGGAIALILAPIACVVGVGSRYKKRSGLRHLSDKEATLLLSIGEVYIGKENKLGIQLENVPTLEGIDEFLDIASESERREIHFLLLATEHVLPLLKFNFSRFTELSLGSRREILEHLENSKKTFMRLYARVLRSLVFMSFFNHEKVHGVLGHKGWCGP